MSEKTDEAKHIVAWNTERPEVAYAIDAEVYTDAAFMRLTPTEAHEIASEFIKIADAASKLADGQSACVSKDALLAVVNKVIRSRKTS